MRQIIIFLLLNSMLVSCIDLGENKWEDHLNNECECISFIEAANHLSDYRNEPVACSRKINDTIKWGFIKGSNCEEITPFKFDDADFFGCGLAPVKLNGYWGAVNKKGNLIIKNKFKELETFHDSLASFCDSNKNWGIIDTQGNIIVKPKYQFINPYHANIAFAQLHTGKWIILNNKGDELPIKIDNLVSGYYGDYDEHRRINVPWGYIGEKEFFDYPIYSNGKKVNLYVYNNEFALLDEKIDTRLITVGEKKIPKDQLKSIY